MIQEATAAGLGELGLMYPVLHKQEVFPGYFTLGTHTCILMEKFGVVSSSVFFCCKANRRPRRERSPALPCPQNPSVLSLNWIDVLSLTLMSITAVHVYLEISG